MTPLRIKALYEKNSAMILSIRKRGLLAWEKYRPGKSPRRRHYEVYKDWTSESCKWFYLQRRVSKWNSSAADKTVLAKGSKCVQYCTRKRGLVGGIGSLSLRSHQKTILTDLLICVPRWGSQMKPKQKVRINMTPVTKRCWTETKELRPGFRKPI